MFTRFRSVATVLLEIVMIVFQCNLARSQEQVWESNGFQKYDRLGSATGVIADVNGDGFPDALAGAPQWSGGVPGYVRVCSGLDGSTLLTVTGSTVGTSFGLAVVGVNDWNGDGVSDFAVGEPGANYSGTAAGRVWLYSGKDGTVLHTLDGSAGEQFGVRLSLAGDVNLDGLQDIVMTAGHYALVVSGRDWSTLWNLTGISSYGWTGDGAGDVDLDGWPDLVVGVANNQTAGVFSGRTGGLLHTWSGNPFGGFGSAVSGAGDTNGDGFADVLVGDPADSSYKDHGGSAYLYSGKDWSLLHFYQPEGTYWRMGVEVGDGGDVNRDGFDDFYIGASGAWQNYSPCTVGLVVLYSGKDGRFIYHHAGFNDSACDFGESFATRGDFDADGNDDLLVGAPGRTTNSLDEGTACLRRGNDLLVDAIPKCVSANDTLYLQLGQGIGGNLAAVYVVMIDGLPTSNLLLVGHMDSTGRLLLQGTVPPNLGVHTVGFKGFEIDATGKVIDSGIETLYLQ